MAPSIPLLFNDLIAICLYIPPVLLLTLSPPLTYSQLSSRFPTHALSSKPLILNHLLLLVYFSLPL
jgi:hypothetical protein